MKMITEKQLQKLRKSLARLPVIKALDGELTRLTGECIIIKHSLFENLARSVRERSNVKPSRLRELRLYLSRRGETYRV